MPTVDFQYQGTSSTPCPLCGFYGLHNCTGQRVGTVWAAPPPDWNRLIAVLERAVALAEKLLLNDGSGGVGAQGDDPDAPLVKDALRPTHRDGVEHER